MCDETTQRELNEHLKKKALTRRTFAAGASAALAATGMPRIALAAPKYAREYLSQMAVMVPTPDGNIDGVFIHPKAGAHAAVIFWPDIHGMRPAHFGMAQRLAMHGYAVFAANPYYRTHRGQLFYDGLRYGDPGAIELVTPHYSVFSPETVKTDAAAITQWLDTQSAVDTKRSIGAVGFCMTGSWTLRAAAAVPGRIKAPCSFHGGGLVTQDKDSPHTLAAEIKGGALIAIAENDHKRQPGAKETLIKAFKAANVPAEIEVYAGAMHGWVPTDSSAYHPEQAERGWSRMLTLFEAQLGAA